MKKIIHCILIVTSIIGSLHAQDCNDSTHHGEGTFYGGVAGSSGGNCSLPVDADDMMHAAMNDTDYNNSDACGACLEVTGSEGSVIVKVVDRCPECAEGDVDLTQEAFSEIADPIDGRVDISWKYVPCSLRADPGAIKINFKSGSSVYYTAIQFRDIEHAISTMEYKATDGSWVAVDRVLYNFFIEYSGISSPMDLRITSILGEQLTFTDIPIDTNNDYNTNQQFSTPDECSTDGVDTTEEIEEETEEVVTTSSNIVHITKRNSTGFAFDGGNDGANGQDVYLWAADEDNVNQQWVELDRGDGFYSYQKYGTNYCIDGNFDGANNQEVYLWDCGINNYNQHWEKVAVGDGGYQLIKRNATGFALNGGSGGTNGRIITLYDSSNSSQNLQWYVTPISVSAKSLDVPNIKEVTSDFKVYPNPGSGLINISGNNNLLADPSLTILCSNLSGESFTLDYSLTNNSIKLDASTLAPGIYMVSAYSNKSLLFTNKLVIE